MDLTARGDVKSISGISHARIQLKERNVCERQAAGAKKTLMEVNDVNLKCEYADSHSVGSDLILWADCGNTIIGADSLGAKKLKAEDVGRKVAEQLIAEIKSDACLDKHIADQIVPYIALAGGEATVSQITEHAKTNVWVCQQFGYKIEIEGKSIKSK